MAIFDRLAFLEGEQADAYKRRKEAERDEKLRQERERYERRYNKNKPGIKHSSQYVKANLKNHPIKTLGNYNNIKQDGKKETERLTSVYDKLGGSDEFVDRMLLDKTGEAAGVSKKEMDRLRRFVDDDASKKEKAQAAMMLLSRKGKDLEMKSGMAYDADSLYKHMRRHPEKYSESTIFESVKFLNE